MTAVKNNLELKRVVSGMRTTGNIHLGNYHGALKNWLKLQHEYDCYFFAADWHALTTHYESAVTSITDKTWDMVRNWLAAGLDPDACTIFIQSGVLEHAELHLLLSMITPLGWLERVPTYKDQQAKLAAHDLSTYGFLGYPVLQSADVLAYKGNLVPVGEDQVAHIELTREIARRFNFIYGRGDDFQRQVEQAMQKMGKSNAKAFRRCIKKYQEQGELSALQQGQALILKLVAEISTDDQEVLTGHLEGRGKTILPEPEPLLTPTAKFPGLDGQKMSKSYNNTIELTEEPKSVETKIKTMPTDPNRVRRTDPGDPNKCPVWELHKIYSSQEVQQWVQQGCTSAGIGCIDCKGPLITSIVTEQTPIRERYDMYNDASKLTTVIDRGIERARSVARSTLSDVREAIGIVNL